jgi:hypothetical protein
VPEFLWTHIETDDQANNCVLFFAFIWSTSQLGVVDTHFGRSVAELHTKRFSCPSGQHLSARLHDARGPESCRPRVGFVG